MMGVTGGKRIFTHGCLPLRLAYDDTNDDVTATDLACALAQKRPGHPL
jgi:hypothetical protein